MHKQESDYHQKDVKEFIDENQESNKVLGVVFTMKDIANLKKESGAISKNDLIQRLADPPRKFRPSTNMNRTGHMTALNMTY